MRFEHLSSPPVISGVRVTRSLVLCDRCLIPLSFFFWPLCCLFFFYLRILITPLVSSNSSFDCLYLTFSQVSCWSILLSVHCIVDYCLSYAFCSVCPSTYGFFLLFWYLQFFLSCKCIECNEHYMYLTTMHAHEKFKDTKRVIRSRESKDRQYKCQERKKTYNNLHNTT
jgi:hypothetical protein